MKQYISIVAFIVFSQSIFAQSEVFSTNKGAINGYDAVAYFIDSKAVEGKKENSFVWKGETWHFTSTKNLDLFKSNPEKYAPQFGGFCAYGVADGHKAKTDPQSWTVVDGKLYLNYNKDVQQLWKKDQKNFIIKANQNWVEVKKEKY